MSPTGDLHVTMIFDREDVALGLPEHSYVLPQHGTLLGAAHPLGGQFCVGTSVWTCAGSLLVCRRSSCVVARRVSSLVVCRRVSSLVVCRRSSFVVARRAEWRFRVRVQRVQR